MKMRTLMPLLAIIALALPGCGGSTLTGGTETGNTDKLAAAVTSLFGGNGSEAQLKRVRIPQKLLAMLVREAQAQSGPPTSACDENNSSPGDITMSTTIAAGTYGLSSNEVTVTAADGCAEGGQYMAFTVASHTMNCEDGSGTTTSLTMEESTGIWRINPTTSKTEIFGTFNITSGSSTASGVRCSFTIDNSSGTDGEFSGDCEDASGNALSQATDTTCTDA